MKAESTIDIGRFFAKNRYLLLVLVLGVVLMLIPGDREAEVDASATEAEQRLCNVLQSLEGVGTVNVLLSEEKGRSEGYTGAVIVCRGADSASVRLQIVEAVSVYTGLSSNKIMVLKMKG